MMEDFNDDEFIIEIKILTDKVEKFQEALDDYCAFMKETFLSMSNQN